MLPRLVGYGGAMLMLLSGDPVDADTALKMGLVEQVVPDDALEATGLALATKIAGFSPDRNPGDQGRDPHGPRNAAGGGPAV